MSRTPTAIRRLIEMPRDSSCHPEQQTTEPPNPDQGGAEQIALLLPVLDDWEALGRLLREADGLLAASGLRVQIVVVDDGSAVPETGLADLPDAAIDACEVLRLRRNLGHQRAIAIGLAYLEAERPNCEFVVVLDSDGEDDPHDIPRLVAKCRASTSRAIVFAERHKRSESLTFRVCYHLYRLVHRVLTGRSVRVGNFSVLPRQRLSSLVAVSDLWNHYAAAAYMSRQPIETVPTHRARRLAGRSRMNFVGLVTHGLSAISVYSEIIGVRLLLATVGLIGLVTLALVATTLIRLFTHLAIPGWATTMFGVLLILLFQATLFLFVFSFMILAGRNAAGFLPRRDYLHFVESRREVPRR